MRCGSGYLRLPAIGQGCGCGDPRLGESNVGRLLANRSRGVSASARRLDRSPRRGLCRTYAIWRQRSRNMLVSSCIGANRLLLCEPGAYLAPIARLINGRRIVRSMFTVSGCPAGSLEYRLRRGEMPATTRAAKLALRSVWLTPTETSSAARGNGGAGLRTDRCGCGNAWCNSQKVRDLAHDHTGEPASRRAREMRL